MVTMGDAICGGKGKAANGDIKSPNNIHCTLPKNAVFSYLNHTNAEEIKICNSTKLFKQILRYKIPYCVLQ